MLLQCKHVQLCLILLICCKTSYGSPVYKIKQLLISNTQTGLIAGVGEVCANNNDCAGPGAHCTGGYCACNEGFIVDNQHCKQVCTGCIGMNECKLRNTVCVNSICECEHGYTLVDGRCKSVTLAPKSLGTSCITSDDCGGSNTECGNNGKCQCEPFFVPVIDRCLPETSHTGACESSIQCPQPTDCCNQNLTCECKVGTVYDVFNTQSCIERTGFSASCEFDVQCDYNNGQCNNSVCGCIEDHGPSITGEGCIPKTERSLLGFELPDLTFSENLNNPDSAEFAQVQDTLNIVMDGVREEAVDAGINVIDLSLDSFEGNPSGSGSILLLLIEAYDSDLDPSYITSPERNRRLKRSTTQLGQELQLEVDRFIKRVEDKRKIKQDYRSRYITF